MIKRYAAQHNLPLNPARQAGALTIGCMYCGGGAQFDNSGFRVLRHTAPAEWLRMIKDYQFGPIILAIKYQTTLAQAQGAIDRLGGIDAVASKMPHIFDFLRIKPLKGYDRSPPPAPIPARRRLVRPGIIARRPPRPAP
jgi:hypothetical protein